HGIALDARIAGTTGVFLWKIFNFPCSISVAEIYNSAFKSPIFLSSNSLERYLANWSASKKPGFRNDKCDHLNKLTDLKKSSISFGFFPFAYSPPTIAPA